MRDFKINDYACRTVGGVQYVGRVRKKEEDDKGLRIWVQFTPPVEGRGVDRPYIEFKPHELEPVSLMVNPPLAVQLDDRDWKHDHIDERRIKKPRLPDPDLEHPLPKTER